MIKSTAKRTFPLSKVYGLLEPGPVVLLTTTRGGGFNVMPMAWHTMLEFVPPLVGCVVSSQNYSFETLRRTGECVLNVPTVKMARKVVACGNTSGETTDKFAEFGLTPVAGTVVKAPMIAECFASLECQVRNRKLVAQYNFFVLEVVRAWVKSSRRLPATLHHHGEGLFTTPGRKFRLPSPKTSLRGE